MQAFLAGSKPECQPLTMEVIDVNNNHSSETHYVTTVDIQNMDSCLFSNQKNPITGQNCRQAFSNANGSNYDNFEEINKNFLKNPINQLYIAGFVSIIILFLYKFQYKV